MFKRTLNPSAYHGKGVKPPFFEGWYYKLVDKLRKDSLAIIPGIFLHGKQDRATAFIQVVDGSENQSHYIPYPIDSFKPDSKKFDIRLATSEFSAERIHLDINRNGVVLKGDLEFDYLNPWPVTLSSPGIMGWYAWVPYMECFHGIVSLDHVIRGSLELNGKKIDFSDGRGYTEKDWGRAFPEAWIWLQSNHFSEPGISFTGSIAIIPWIGKAFPGFIIGFLWEGTLYRFATYTGAKTLKLELNGDTVHWVVADRKHELEIYAKKTGGSPLQAPTPDGMKRQITESIGSFMEIRFSQKIKTGNTVIFQGNGYQSGMEIEGNTEKLLDMARS